MKNTQTTNIDKEINELTDKLKELKDKKIKIEFEAGRLHHNDDVNNYLMGYGGKRLIEKYELTYYGIWEILGEDPNCDYAGSHHQPHIAYVEGTLEKALLYAVKQPKWLTWGGGGDIKPIPEKLIIKL